MPMFKKFSLASLMMLSAIALSACGGTESEEAYEMMENAESLAQLTWQLSGTNVAMDCAEGWTCTEEYGGSIMSMDNYNSVMLYEVWGDDMEELLQTNTDLITSGGNREVIETYEWTPGVNANIIQDTDSMQVWWLSVWNAEGKSDYPVKCQASLSGDSYETAKADVEAMCGSARAE